MKLSVICILCTPLNAVSAASTPGVSGQSKGKIQKFTAQMRHSCTISGRKQPEKLIRQRLFFPLSIKDGEGARG
jgi:hypothetical protein